MDITENIVSMSNVVEKEIAEIERSVQDPIDLMNCPIFITNESISELETLDIFSVSAIETVSYSQLEENEVCENNVDTQNVDENDVDILHEPAETEDEIIEDQVKKTRRRGKNYKKWKSVERKIKHQSGEEYINHRGKMRPKKEVKDKKDCLKSCRYKCMVKIDQKNRNHQFKSYYKLDQNGKYHFLINTTEMINKKRATKKDSQSRRQKTFKYYFFVNNDKIQVCKTFYLSTLNISQKPVYNVHKKKNQITNVPQIDLRGKSSKKHVVCDAVRDHINSFPAIDSHYCRAKTNKKYLEANLNVCKMYDLYLNYCKDRNEEPVKQCMYRYIFCNEFNIDFHKPKSDRCGTCEKYLVAKEQGNINNEDVDSYDIHIKMKEEMRAEKKKDKENKDIPILCFDLQNVITCPKADIGPFFYKSKLNIFNLTAHLSTTKTVYCALWSEFLSGRSGNDIASAFIRILHRVLKDNEISELVTWSDSCVPQNRNSIISFAVQEFMQKHSTLKKITMKYSVPGHSCIQEVDHAHSVIEKVLNKAEFFSPMGLIRLLKTVNRSKPYVILQMREEDFKDYSACAQVLHYKNIPFASVTMLEFLKDSRYNIGYKKTYGLEEFNHAIIDSRKRKLNENSLQLKQLKIRNVINEEKRNHFIFMMDYMNAQDKAYFETILNAKNDQTNEKQTKPKSKQNKK